MKTSKRADVIQSVFHSFWSVEKCRNLSKNQRGKKKQKKTRELITHENLWQDVCLKYFPCRRAYKKQSEKDRPYYWKNKQINNETWNSESCHRSTCDVRQGPWPLRLLIDLHFKNNPSKLNQTASSSHFVHISVEQINHWPRLTRHSLLPETINRLNQIK